MAKFVLSSSNPKYYPEHSLSEIAFVGPSNAGKSTLINALAKSKIAHISKKPGKTKTLNFYDFEKFFLVDMPGYGYAKVSRNMRESLLKILDLYFLNRKEIIGVCHICSPHAFSDKDIEVFEYLSSRFDNYLLLINKSDKLSKLQNIKLKQSIVKEINISEEKILFISAKEFLNIDLLKSKLLSWL